jgi:hypothetical protein
MVLMNLALEQSPRLTTLELYKSLRISEKVMTPVRQWSLTGR